jgi:hypothetical protein
VSDVEVELTVGSLSASGTFYYRTGCCSIGSSRLKAGATYRFSINLIADWER